MRRGDLWGRIDVAYNHAAQLGTADSLYPRKTISGLVEKMSGGGTPNTTVAEYWNGGINWVSPKDFSGELVISSSGLNISEKGRSAARLELLPRGSVVIVVRSGVLAHTLPAAVLTEQAAINQDIKALILT